jgi:hypothetical protein
MVFAKAAYGVLIGIGVIWILLIILLCCSACYASEKEPEELSDQIVTIQQPSKPQVEVNLLNDDLSAVF